MKIVKMQCPNCGANIDFSDEKKISFCPYCGTKLYFDDEVKRSEHTKNININKNVTYRDETRAEVERELAKQEKYKTIRESIKPLATILIVIILIAFFFIDMGFLMSLG